MSHNIIESAWNVFGDTLSTVQILQLCSRCAFFLTLVLCAWTHPQYHHSRLARLFRVPIAAVSASWWLCYPFMFTVKPQETNLGANVGQYAICFILMTKCLDWGLFSGPQVRRRYVINDEGSTGNWEPAEKNIKDQLPFYALAGHVFLQLTSLRGIQYPWGHFSQINQNTWKRDLSKFILCHTYSLGVVAGLLYLQKYPCFSIFNLFISPGWKIASIISGLERCMRTFFIITGLCASFEALNSTFAMLAHILHPVLCWFHFPEIICDFANPVYYPALFANLFEAKSLAQFWGKAWHQIFRRSFVILGSFPLAGLARAMGGSNQIQRTIGFVGAFIASGFFHAYPFFLMADPETPTGCISMKEKASVFLCFIGQGVGILVEPFVIPLLPKCIGGGKLWTIGFLLLTLPIFSTACTKPGRLFTIFKPLEEWDIYNLLVPVVISPIFNK